MPFNLSTFFYYTLSISNSILINGNLVRFFLLLNVKISSNVVSQY